MKKFLLVLTGLLLFSTQANAACYAGMPLEGTKSQWGNSVNRNWGAIERRILVCTKCSGGTCTAVDMGGVAQQGCKKNSTSGSYPCLQCVDNAEMVTSDGGNGCQCKKGYYSKLRSGNSYLYDCLKLNISITGGTCTNAGKYGNSDPFCTSWECNSGYYKTDKDNGYCKSCSGVSVANGTCTACAATNCIAVSCNPNCNNPRMCKKDCTSCSGVTCTSATCSAGYAWNGSGCARLNCAAGQYVNGNSCAACPSGQWSKGGTAMSCSPCSSLSVANGKCASCSASGSCTAVSCNGGYKASGASCVQVSCPAGQYVNGNSCAACPSGQWSKGGTATSCSPCSSLSVANGTCTACTAAGACSEISCNDGYVFKAGACVVKKCMAGTYEDASGNCRPCSDIAVVGGVCTSCSYDGSVCESVSCAEGWTNASVTSCTATKTCSAGGFWDEESQSCKRCDTYMIANGGCVECDAKACSKAECDKPNMTFDQSAQKCGVACADNQRLDTSFECQACEKGQYAAGGWSAEATSCTSCSTIAVEGGTCVECSDGACLKASCSDGYRLDDTGTKCLKNAANCLDGLSVTADGCCCAK